MKVALITGITGQDGAYLARLLLSLGYTVHGIKRRSSSFNTGRIADLNECKRFHIHNGDLTDASNLMRIVTDVQPDEVYNLAAQSHVQVSFEMPEYTGNVDGLGAVRLLELIKKSNKPVRFYQASTSELYGKVREFPQSETTPFYPRSPYGVAKLYAYWITINYRESYGIHASNGILFNHESPLRGENFITRKITRAAARIKLGLESSLSLGNLDAKRDWGHAREYVEGMYRIVQHDTPGDYVLATGKATSVREFVKLAFDCVDIPLEFSGKGVNEIGVSKLTGETVVSVDAKYYRPSEVDFLLGDPAKAKRVLGWEPKVTVEELCMEMVEHDLRLSLPVI